MMTGRPANSAWPLVIAALLFVVLASLYPFVDWRDPGVPPWAFVEAPWPKYYTLLDLALNVVFYLPLGFVLTAGLQSRLKPGWAAIASVTLGGLLSLVLEMGQVYLPSRVASNLDVGCNLAGMLMGAVGGMIYGRTLVDGAAARWRHRRILRGRVGDAGILLLSLWMLGQLQSGVPLFAVGVVRDGLGLLPGTLPDVTALMAAERLRIACGAVGVSVIAWQSQSAKSIVLLAALWVGTFALKSLSGTLLAPPQPLYWVHASTLAGMAWGLGATLCALLLPAAGQRALGALALVFGILLSNLIPDNPYQSQVLRLVQEGHVINFNGLTRVTMMFWPYCALIFLLTHASRGQASRV